MTHIHGSVIQSKEVISFSVLIQEKSRRRRLSFNKGLLVISAEHVRITSHLRVSCKIDFE